jgi:hypothetical protein
MIDNLKIKKQIIIISCRVYLPRGKLLVGLSSRLIVLPTYFGEQGSEEEEKDNL